MKDEIVDIVTRKTEGIQDNDKGMIYCRSKKASEQLAEKLRCQFYHSGMAEKQRQEMLKRWSKGQSDNRWITATTGLGTGVDIEEIVAVMHMEMPWGLVDFVQQTGRGGRRAETTMKSVIVMKERQAWFNKQGGDIEHLNRQAMEKFAVDGWSWVSLWTGMEGIVVRKMTSYMTGVRKKKRKK